MALTFKVHDRYIDGYIRTPGVFLKINEHATIHFQDMHKYYNFVAELSAMTHDVTAEWSRTYKEFDNFTKEQQ